MPEHPAVALLALIGVRDERTGQVGQAFVVRRGPVSAERSRTPMAGFTVPRSVRSRDALPVNATGA